MKESALVQFKLLLPADLKERLEAVALQRRRSLSQEIVARLFQSFEIDKEEVIDWLKDLDKRTEKLESDFDLMIRRGGVSGGED